MAWKQNVVYFELPLRKFCLFGVENREHLHRDGWVFESGDSIFMLPQQYRDLYNSEFWVGVKKDEKQFVHCLDTQRPRVIEKDNKNPLIAVYETYNDGTPPFYRIEDFEFFEITGEKPVKRAISKTYLMNVGEIESYCNEWITAISSFPKNDFSDIGLLVTKDRLIQHFINSREKIVNGSKILPKLLEEYGCEKPALY